MKILLDECVQSSPAACVAQIFNLPYRRIGFGRTLEPREAGGLQIRDTAECNSALQRLQSEAHSEISGPAGRKIAILELSTNDLRRIQAAEALIQTAIETIQPRDFRRLGIPF